jgi:LysM repeat protein
LFSIGKALGVDWQTLASANGLTAPYLIHPGDKLAVPGARVYVVKQGDWLYKIARSLGIDWANLARVNGLTAPYLIQPGDVLTLP